MTKGSGDQCLGLIIKPKNGYPETVLESRVRLLNLSLETGRCCLLDEGIITSKTLLCELSLAPGMGIGFRLSGTASLESRLAGTPTVLSVAWNTPYYTFYVLPRKSVGFSSWDELWSSTETFRPDPAAMPYPREKSNFIGDMDPFQDGGPLRG